MKRIIAIIICVALALTMAGCTEAEKVSHNVSKEADAFNVVRRLTVINTRTDTILMQMTGTFSIMGGGNSSNKELSVICELEDGTYQKHYVYLNEWTTYVVEDISGSDVSKYSYELNFLPLVVPNVKIDVTD